MKKLISLALALVMILSLSTVAFADGEIKYKTTNPAIDKSYTANNGTAPAETFAFTATYTGYTSVGQTVTAENCKKPDLTVASATYAEGAETSTQSLTITTKDDTTLDADKFDIGTYTYTLKETAGTTAGVKYDGSEFTLELIITWNEGHTAHKAQWTLKKDGVKTESGFENEYSSGALSVKKVVEGDMGDQNQLFYFTITLTAPAGKTVKSTVTVNKPDGTSETKTFAEGKLVYTIQMKHNDTVKFTNLPVGVTYEVTEDENVYTQSTTYSDSSKTIAYNDDDVVTVTNTLGNTANTGIVLDSMPYILLLTLAAAGMFVLLTKKRAKEY